MHGGASGREPEITLVRLLAAALYRQVQASIVKDMQVGGGQQSRWSSLVGLGKSMQVYASLGKCAGTSNPSKHSSSSSSSSWARQVHAMQPGVNQQSR